MYGWLWRRLPGNTGTRLLAAGVLVAGVAAVLWYVVFPLLEPAMTVEEVTVGR